jgi:hypothetical protein
MQAKHSSQHFMLFIAWQDHLSDSEALIMMALQYI